VLAERLFDLLPPEIFTDSVWLSHNRENLLQSMNNLLVGESLRLARLSNNNSYILITKDTSPFCASTNDTVSIRMPTIIKLPPSPKSSVGGDFDDMSDFTEEIGADKQTFNNRIYSNDFIDGDIENQGIIHHAPIIENRPIMNEPIHPAILTMVTCIRNLIGLLNYLNNTILRNHKKLTM